MEIEKKMEGESDVGHTGVKEYCSLLLEGLPSGWCEQPGVTGGHAVSAATKHDIFGPGVAVLQESCCHGEDKSAIMKISCLPGTTIKSTLPGVKTSVIYKETSTLSLALEDLYYIDVLKKTCMEYGVFHTKKSATVFVIEGAMDRLIDFRRAFDRAILTCRNPPSTSGELAVSVSAEQPSIPKNQPSIDSGGTANMSLNEFFPPSLFDAYTNLHPDALAILQKIPAGKIPGIHYDPNNGTIFVDKEGDRESAIASFQKEYQNVIDGRRLKVDGIAVASGMPDADISEISSDFNGRYSQCVFSFERDTRVMKIVSVSSRQFDQAKKQLSECLLTAASCFVPIDEHGRILTLKRSNIVLEEVDVIVNAANGALRHGGGVALAIDRASGGAVQKQSEKITKSRGRKGDYKVGNVVVTGAGGALKCKYVIHAVGPTKDHHTPGDALRILMINVLREAQRLKAKSIAIPAISAGLFSVDNNLVAKSILDVILNVFKYPPKSVLVSDVRVVIINQPTYQCFFNYLRQQKLVSPPSKKHSLKDKEDPPAATSEATISDMKDETPSTVPDELSAGLDGFHSSDTVVSIVSAEGPEVSKAGDGDNRSKEDFSKEEVVSDHPSTEEDVPDHPRAEEDMPDHPRAGVSDHPRAEEDVPDRPRAGVSDYPRVEEDVSDHPKADTTLTDAGAHKDYDSLDDGGASENVGDCEEVEKAGESADVPDDDKDLAEYYAPKVPVKVGLDEFSKGDEVTVCSKVIEIMLPIAYKWHMLAKALKFPTDMANKIACANENDARKFEVMVREWWHMKRGQDRGLILCSILHHVLKEEQMARQVWKFDVFTSWPEGGPVDVTPRSSDSDIVGYPKVGVRPDAYLVDFSTPDEDTDVEELPAVTVPSPTCLDASLPPPVTASASPAVILSPEHATKSPVIYSRSCSLVHPSNPFEAPEFADDMACLKKRGDNGGVGETSAEEGVNRAWPDLGSDSSKDPTARKDSGSSKDTHHSERESMMPHEVVSRRATSPAPPSPPPYSGHMMQRVASSPEAGSGGGASAVPKLVTPPASPRLLKSPKKSPPGSPKKSSHKRVCGICKKDIKVMGRALCGHRFCKNCILDHFHRSPRCPVCNVVVQPLQPSGGTMARNLDKDLAVPGYEGVPTIVIEYEIPGGTQGQWHPSPGRPFLGVKKTAYVPCTSEGEEVVRLLRKAFEGRWLFTVGRHPSTHHADVVVWSDVEHKTSLSSGRSGYPDSHYLTRVKKQLAAKGITS